jgi:peptidoglycan/LPS O-acetylase OafA/YrhL
MIQMEQKMQQYSKAIVALIMALIGIANTFFNAGVNVSPETVNTVVALLTPLLVYIVPNKPKAE